MLPHDDVTGTQWHVLDWHAMARMRLARNGTNEIEENAGLWQSESNLLERLTPRITNFLGIFGYQFSYP